VIEDLTPADVADSAVQTTLLPVEQRAVLALNSTKTEEHLLELAAKHKDITVIKNKAGRDQAHGAAMELKNARTTIEKVAKEARDDATKFSKAVIAEEKRLIGIIEAEEDRLFAVRDAWDAEQERIRKEKAEAEERRVAAIRARIEAIASTPVQCASMTAKDIESEILVLELTPVDESFEEFQPHAQAAIAAAVSKLRELHEGARNREAEAAKLAAERAELERIRAEQAAQAAELERQRKAQEEANARAAAEVALAAQRAIDEANAKSKREAAERESFLRQQEDAFAAEKAAAQALLDKQEQELAEERRKIAAHVAEQQRKEAVEKAEKEAQERRAREDAALAFASRVVAVVAEAFEIDPEEAEEYITRAAATIAANDKVAA
jgi:hypothetical protein